MDKNFRLQEERIEALFPEELDDITVCNQTLKIYKEFLDKNIVSPVKVTGIEDFNWGEYYILGPGDKNEYEMLKKTRPSYQDTFNLIRIDDNLDEDYGLFANVVRISDKKEFQIKMLGKMICPDSSACMKMHFQDLPLISQKWLHVMTG